MTGNNGYGCRRASGCQRIKDPCNGNLGSIWCLEELNPAHLTASQLEPRPALALPMFHAFTGYDTVSLSPSLSLPLSLFFAGKATGRAWKVWQLESLPRGDMICIPVSLQWT